MTEVRIDPAVASYLRLGVVEADAVTVRDHDPGVWAEIEAVSARLREAYAGREPSGIGGVRPARELYHRIGVDPTKLRPSSEALLRRVLRGGGLPRINSLVDICNLCSLEFLLPIGLHDLDRTTGGIVLRRGRPGEGYEAIGKGWYAADGRLVAADDEGPCGSPTSDSQRTMITGATRRCLMLIYAPSSYEPARLEAHVAATAGRLTRFAGGRIVQAGVR
ncbi:MAG: phenylalanine--tRNA ligase beta subunit-related protein [Armatimonadota bacterium]|nr:phenylalanine--tRNA ligase beta subunit-related protein [Armatimonadota bacterium]MDR7549452.1 phenylalanine--tRNA ligase beta subunit-related protein [Armatimonadota bacterium]